ncbi:hypothetical protein PHLCEN_2v5117 [Hermanssonia centrifuga]|uniref:DASH complex subunit DAD2 n=1 Tax=Hermanssonia centrifuga TaxID=98765 RepID=A0A2R6PBT7_9APHY|nr:hypothetical protein PHLCEN_2v5117 [Hermanssonia centrifuga]
MRQSIAPLRQSHLPPQAVNAAAQAKYLEKKKEFEAAQALEKASTQFLKRIEALGDDFDVMADAGTVHGQVLEQWPNMFRILSLFLASREGASETVQPSDDLVAGERLVRVPIEELKSGEQRA